jgi:hypothetical protein
MNKIQQQKQIVFIDDSGDPGFKLDKGSSAYFVIACVIFDDPLDAEETALIIKKFRRSLGWADYREFKFNKTKKDIIAGLLNEVVSKKFRVRAISMDKSKIRSHELKNRQDSFYNYTIKEYYLRPNLCIMPIYDLMDILVANINSQRLHILGAK